MIWINMAMATSLLRTYFQIKMTSLVLRGLSKFVRFNSRNIRLQAPLTLSACDIFRPAAVITRASLSTTHILEKKGKNKQKSEKPVIDELLDAVEEEDEEDEAAAFTDTVGQRESELKSLLIQQSKGKKPSKGSTQMSYAEFVKIVPGEKLWNDLESILENLKNIYLHQLSLRSASSIGK